MSAPRRVDSRVANHQADAARVKIHDEPQQVGSPFLTVR